MRCDARRGVRRYLHGVECRAGADVQFNVELD